VKTKGGHQGAAFQGKIAGKETRMKNEISHLSLSIGRRRFTLGLAGLAAASLVPTIGAAQTADGVAAQKIADHFSSVKTMMGEFVQFGPRGEQTGGKFFIERPGKLRFNFEDPSPVRVIADGDNVAIGNMKLKTWDLYPLSKTPLSLLLATKIDLTNQMVRDVKQEPDLTTIVLGNKSVFGDSTITMMFDSKTFDLRQWTITDAQNKDTSVMVYNVREGVSLDEKVFAIPYNEIRKPG
jgi:outer membrane lipoprotein-sorting protein